MKASGVITFTVNAVPVLVHVFALVTVIVPLYTAMGAAPGTVSTIGLLVSVALLTGENPAVPAALLHVML